MLAFARFTRSERESRPSRINNLDVYYLQNIGEIYFFSAAAHLLLNKNPFCKEVADSAAPASFSPQIVKDDRIRKDAVSHRARGRSSDFCTISSSFSHAYSFPSLRPKFCYGKLMHSKK